MFITGWRMAAYGGVWRRMFAGICIIFISTSPYWRMAAYGSVWPAAYGPRRMAAYGGVWLNGLVFFIKYFVFCVNVWLCIAIHGYVWLCMAMYGKTRQYIVILSNVWLCMAAYGSVWLA